MRPAKILMRPKGGRTRTIKVFTNVRGDRLYPKQLHLGYISVDDPLEAAKDGLFKALVEKWPRSQKPKAIDWEDAEMKLAKVRRDLHAREAVSLEPKSFPGESGGDANESCSPPAVSTEEEEAKDAPPVAL